MQMSEVFSFHW